MKKIKMHKASYYNCNYPPGSVIEVDDNYAKHMLDTEEAIEVDPDTKVTDPIPYIMKQRESPTDKALTVLAELLTRTSKPAETTKPKV